MQNQPLEGEATPAQSQPLGGEAVSMQDRPLEGEEAPIFQSLGGEPVPMQSQDLEGEGAPIRCQPLIGDAASVQNPPLEREAAPIQSQPLEREAVPIQNPPLDREAAPIQSQALEGDVSRPALHNEQSIENLRDAGSITSSTGSSTEEGVPMRRVQSQAYIEDLDRDELRRIATALSTRRFSVAGTDTDAPPRYSSFSHDDPTLQPDNKDFDMSRWLRMFIQRMSSEGISPSRTGVMWKNLTVSGTDAALLHQDTVFSYFTSIFRPRELFSFNKKPKRILNSFDGLIESGELLIVLGRPGSGCTTLLKTLCGQLHGLQMDKASSIHYKGIPQKQMVKEFKGEVIYNQEVDRHFPHLTVGQTLEFAAAARMPSNRIEGVSRNNAVKYVAKVVMAICGLSHTYYTKVGDDFVRGVSGGERKRVSIAEMMLAGAPFGAWDNSTRGLDSATALKFVQSLRLSCDVTGRAGAVAIYQASQAIYDLFDKAVVLYEGRTIYYGPANGAKSYFERQGWFCPQRQTVGDFLTSLTNPQERTPKEGMENQVPRTSEDFERCWRESPEYAALLQQMHDAEERYPTAKHGEYISQMREHKEQRQAKHVRPKSPFIISIWMQIGLNTKRAYQRLWGDKSATLTSFVTHTIMALIIGSVYYGTASSTASFFSLGAVLFMAVLLNALSAITEINSLYNQRAIVEKHASYAFYHPATEAIAGIFADIPIKFVTAVVFNIVIYFLAGLRREPGPFFLFFLISYVSTFVMSAIFRTIAAVTKTVSQAMALAGICVLALVIYTGFIIAVPQMHPWFSWIRWINPLFYAFECLIANEFHNRQFSCASFIPAYSPRIGTSWICDAIGAVPGESMVSGDAFIETQYGYKYSHVWRNFGILIAFMIFFMALYFICTEINSTTSASAEVLVYQRGKVPAHMDPKTGAMDKDVTAGRAERVDEAGADVRAIEPQKDVFTWKNIDYDVEVKEGTRRLLSHVSGWVKPGTLTALMGVSGAGKTTLLDVLAQRTTMGVVYGDRFVNGKPLDASFQRKTGYVQQQDLHLATATVRESLRFSAFLRQPGHISKAEKFAYVEEVIKMLNMTDFADAVVGVPGEGLNVEQRKLLTIGVELAAKPKLLLFLDEPTSGLDSQSSWAICALLRKLADAGQAILCTVHQPSAILFQQFDRLLFLARGGKTVYFGDIGPNSRTLLEYFESNGARVCSDTENPAEYMLEVVNNGTNDQGVEWDQVWNASPERGGIDAEIERLHAEMMNEPVASDGGSHAHSEFAMPFLAQLSAVTLRVFQQYWRMPTYIFAKFFLGTVAGLFIGFTFFQAKGTLAGMQNVLFAVFQVITIFSSLVQQIQPLFITQRSLYEVRERPSKSYSWKAFIIANVLVEIPYQIFTGILIYASFYYAVVGIQSSERQGLVLLFCIQLLIYASSFAQMTIAALHDAQTAGGIVTLLVMFSLVFCGVLQPPSALPGFWIFMYRASPFTYWTAGMVATQLHDRPVDCSTSETSVFSPPSGQTCGEYMQPYLTKAPGRLQNPQATQDCQYCSLRVADQYLAGSNIYWSERWRNFGIVWAYVVFNIFVAVVTYYLFRVKSWKLGSIGSKKKREKKDIKENKLPEKTHNTEMN